MIIAVLLWLFVITVSLGYGLIFEAITQKSFSGIFTNFHWRQIFYWVAIGFSLVNGIAAFLSLIMPLSFWALLLVSLPSIGFLLVVFIRHLPFRALKQSNWQPSTLVLVAFFILTILTLYLTSGRVAHSDTYIYHAQSIRWIEEYRAVKGLGNFFNRLAYNSNWFVQNALFSFAWVNGKSLHVLNGFLIWLTGSYWLFRFDDAIQDQKNDLFSWVGLMLVVFGLFTLGAEAPAPSTDLPTAHLAWLAVFFLLDFFAAKQNNTPLFAGVLLLAFSGVIKISIAPIYALVLLAFIFLYKLDKKREILIIIFLMAFIFLPWMMRNFIISGYLVYPVASTGLPAAWTMPLDMVVKDARGIQAWGYHSHSTIEEVFSLSMKGRITLWFRNLTLNQRGIFLISFYSPLLFFGFQWVRSKREQKRLNGFEISVFSVFYLCLIFWLFTSPNLRFGYVYLLVLLSISLSSLLLVLLQLVNLKARRVQSLVLLGVMVILLFILIQSFDAEQLGTRLLSPFDYAERSTYPCQINDGQTTIFCAADWGECGYQAFPCHAWGNDDVLLFGESYLEGFYSQK